MTTTRDQWDSLCFLRSLSRYTPRIATRSQSLIQTTTTTRLNALFKVATDVRLCLRLLKAPRYKILISSKRSKEDCMPLRTTSSGKFWAASRRVKVRPLGILTKAVAKLAKSKAQPCKLISYITEKMTFPSSILIEIISLSRGKKAIKLVSLLYSRQESKILQGRQILRAWTSVSFRHKSLYSNLMSPSGILSTKRAYLHPSCQTWKMTKVIFRLIFKHSLKTRLFRKRIIRIHFSRQPTYFRDTNLQDFLITRSTSQKSYGSL